MRRRLLCLLKEAVITSWDAFFGHMKPRPNLRAICGDRCVCVRCDMKRHHENLRRAANDGM